MNFAQSVQTWAKDRSRLEREFGIVIPEARAYLPAELKRDWSAGAAMDAIMAMDAQPTLTTAANAGIPAMLTTFIDPDVLRIPFAPLKMSMILGSERKKGDWTVLTAMFPMVETTGDTTSYGDFNNAGSSGANINWPQRQSYHAQTIIQYGEREIAMAATAGVNLAVEKQTGAVNALNQLQNKTYAFGVRGLQCYGLLNDPNLTAAIQPGPKAYNAQAHGPWITSGVVTATPNEVYNDVVSLFIQLVTQTDGIIELDRENKLVLALAPDVAVAFTAANSFNVQVRDLLEKSFPNLRIETAVQYDSGVSGLSGNLAQLICEDVLGQETGYCAFTEKLRMHPLVVGMSNWMQKLSQGTWGAVIRQPFAIAQMLGL
ncbi:MAG TPA: major capsid family protein [Caulobacteraceae bacterium]|jgi:hypothetical protein|nr:major capsid family protein [Caulobacteraceae bacterium]